MGSIEENKKVWTEYNWCDGGDTWSGGWGNTDLMWYRSILPRIHSYFPATCILEIAPGYGRCTAFLQAQCKEMWVVDITKRCIDACRNRFKDKKHVNYVHNDGLSLGALPDNFFDFVFSWDSLVHCDYDVIQSYLEQLEKKMTDCAIGFLHHSNLAAFSSKQKELAKGWRSSNVSAEIFHDLCMDSGLKCTSQEMVPWSSGKMLTDCFSTFTKSSNTSAPDNIISHNFDFIKERQTSKRINELYNFNNRHLCTNFKKENLTQDFFENIFDRKLVGWGSGDYYRECLKRYSFNLSYLVDMDDQKIGQSLNGLNIYSPEILFEENQNKIFIIVFSQQYHKQIYQWLIKHGYTYRFQFYYFDFDELSQMKCISSDQIRR